MRLSYYLKIAVLAMPLVLASCSSKKKVADTQKPVATSPEQGAFLDKVKDNAQSTKFIT